MRCICLKFGVDFISDQIQKTYPTGNYIFKVNNTNTRTMRKTCSELTIKTPEQCQWCHSHILIVNFEHILHLVLVFLFLTLNREMPTGEVDQLT